MPGNISNSQHVQSMTIKELNDLLENEKALHQSWFIASVDGFNNVAFQSNVDPSLTLIVKLYSSMKIYFYTKMTEILSYKEKSNDVYMTLLAGDKIYIITNE